MIYTTYFAKLRSLPENVVPISICGKAPTGYKGIQYKKLAPKFDFFMDWKLTGDNEQYVKCYKEQILDRLNVHEVVNDLINLYSGADIALVCYEKFGDFCHRHLVAEWLREHGYQCEEYIYK